MKIFQKFKMTFEKSDVLSKKVLYSERDRNIKVHLLLTAPTQLVDSWGLQIFNCSFCQEITFNDFLNNISKTDLKIGLKFEFHFFESTTFFVQNAALVNNRQVAIHRDEKINPRI